MQVDGLKISVIIRCKNEEQWIGHSIQSILDNITNPEIIIADNKSNDGSMDIVRMFEHHANIKYLSIPEYSPGLSINTAVIEASYENVLIFSAHCVLKEFHPHTYIKDLDNHVAVFGKQIPIYRGRRITPRYIWSHFIDEKVINMFSDIEKRPFLHNAMCLYKRDFLRSNPFDETLYGKEDRYWALNVQKQKYTILYNPDMICFHHWTEGGATWKGIG